jgi:hypothetical protein
MNPWWTYEEGAIPGLGKYTVNVADGNLAPAGRHSKLERS